MNTKQVELLASIYLKGSDVLESRQSGHVGEACDPSRKAEACEENMADAILVYDLSETDEEHELSIGAIRKITAATDLPVYAGGCIHRLEDVKKLLYAGCRGAFLNYAKEENRLLTEEASLRFGSEKILAWLPSGILPEKEQASGLGGVLTDGRNARVFLEKYPQLPVIVTDACMDLSPVFNREADGSSAGIFYKDSCDPAPAGLSDSSWGPDTSFQNVRSMAKKAGIPVREQICSLTWEEIKTGPDGLLPVVVQDYRNAEVLMVAYMNREAFEQTVRTGRMTYFSRSRQEIWVKGLTSGHFQYVKELRIDCDNDTLLAKVRQVGAACHTGNRSCFYRSIWKQEYADTNPATVLEDVMKVILDRKEHPKEGSYTNYLFDKGLDKILKKVGEEATEIVIAAKNPDPEEAKYEISDFLYHVMVLMAVKGLRWEDIMGELSKR